MRTFCIHRRNSTLLAVLALLLALGSPAFAQRDSAFTRTNSQFLYAFRESTAEASKSTVRVLCNGKESVLGTIVSADGFILTKNSELTGKITCQLKDGKTVDAKIVGVQDVNDLAMLKVDAKGLTPVKFTDSKTAPVGNWVASAGPGDDPVAVGVMSVAVRHPGKDGSRDLRNPKRGFLGIQMEPSEGAVKITVVTKKSAAEKAGVKVGDKVIAVNGEKVDSPETMQKLMSKTKAGDVVKLKVVREDGETELAATLEKVPADRADFQNDMGHESAPLSDRRTGFPSFFQHDTILPAKECGGPICDLDGHVLGINIARAGRTESYTIPSEVITPLLPDLESGKLAPKAEPVKVDQEKKLAELKAAVKKAEEEKAAIEKKQVETKEALKKQEADKAEADKKLKAAKEALEKGEKESK